MKVQHKIGFLLVLICTSLASQARARAAEQSAPLRRAKNVILMIGDGMGFNSVACADYYEHGNAGRQAYEQFPVRLACSTYCLGDDGKATGYDAERFWNQVAHPDDAGARVAATDSAAATTALHTGQKTRRGAINVDVHHKPLTTIGQIAHETGRRVGVVTTVQLSHATPAGVWAHNRSRGRYAAIAKEMICDSGLDVIIGCGHPEYDSNAKPVPPEKKDFRYVGGHDTWNSIKENGAEKGWPLIEDEAAFEAIAANPSKAPRRLLGIPRVRSTLQCKRDGDRINANVPTLATLSRAALNVLGRGDDGFYLTVEGGAVDWANHGRNLPRMLEEMHDFNRAVEAVVAWVEANSSWSETLVIVTSDHECGQLFGPDVSENPDSWPVVNNGKGKLPGAKYYSGRHTNALVPLYAKGPGAGLFEDIARRRDPVYGPFVDNTDIFRVMRQMLGARSAVGRRPFYSDVTTKNTLSINSSAQKHRRNDF